MKYKTSLTDIRDEKEYIRGKSIEHLMANHTFVETLFLLLKGSLPTTEETVMMNALLTAAIDHGPGTASAQNTRVAASAKSDLHVAVASGILAMGKRHGSAIESAAVFFEEHKKTNNIAALVKALKDKKVRVPGYGHPFLSHDHRSDALFVIAKEQTIYGDHCKFSEAFHTELNIQSSKKLALNIDGSMAAILLDMGFAPEIMRGFFLIARVPGLVAHAYEETIQNNGIRRINQDDIEFVS